MQLTVNIFIDTKFTVEQSDTEERPDVGCEIKQWRSSDKNRCFLLSST
jgi:hypothetical protein